MKKLISLLALTLVAELSQADILFIDLNNVEMEIKVAREAAAKRGEKLIVIPKNRDELRKISARAEGYNRLETQYYAAGCGDRQSPNCTQLARRMSAIPEADRYSNGNYGVEQLKKELAELPAGISTVMISGHDGGGSFHGDFGTIEAHSFLNAFKKFKDNDKIKSVYLLGCNSATTHTFGATWKQAFPKAGLIAGYEEIGYLRDNATGHQFIKNVLAEEPKLLAAQSMDEAQRRLKQLFPGDRKHGVAACLLQTADPKDSLYLSSTNNPNKLTDVLGCRPESTEENTRFMACIEANGSNCRLQDVEKLNINLVKRECGFVFPENYSAAANKLYLLKGFTDPNNRLSYKGIFKSLSEDLRQKYKLDEEIETYPQLKDKFLALKKEYESRAHFDSLKNMSMDELRAFVRQKRFFDSAWLTVSNLDISRANEMAYSPAFATDRVSGAITPLLQDLWTSANLRAQAFNLKVTQEGNPALYQQRIKELEAEKTKLDPNIRAQQEMKNMLDREIQSLKNHEAQAKSLNRSTN